MEPIIEDNLSEEVDNKLTVTNSTDGKRKDLTEDRNESPEKSKLESASGTTYNNGEGSSSNGNSRKVPVSTAFLDDMNEVHDCKFAVIKCKNDMEVSVPVSSALQSGMIKSMLDMGFANQLIPLTSLPVSLLEMLMEYWKVHVEGAGCDDEERRKDIQQWKTEFFTRIGPDDLFDLLDAANYLESRELLESGTAFVAEQIKKMQVDEIRAHFGIKNDFTPEEEQQLKKDFPGAFEDIC